MKLELTPEEKAALLPQITRVIETGEPWEDKCLHHPVEAIVNAILSIEGMERCARRGDGFDTNGWQWDWWQHFTCQGHSYTLRGSGYYGGHGFHLSD